MARIPRVPPEPSPLLGHRIDADPLGDLPAAGTFRDHFPLDRGGLSAAMRRMENYIDHRVGKWFSWSVHSVQLGFDPDENEYYITVTYAEESPD